MKKLILKKKQPEKDPREGMSAIIEVLINPHGRIYGKTAHVFPHGERDKKIARKNLVLKAYKKKWCGWEAMGEEPGMKDVWNQRWEELSSSIEEAIKKIVNF